MREVIAVLPAEAVASWEEALRAAARGDGEAPAGPELEAFFDPFRPAAAVASDPEDAIGLVRRGVRLAPFAETTPLLPLYAALGRELPPPLRVASEEQRYEFLLVALTFSLRLDDDESPDHAEFVVKIRDGIDGPRASRAVEVFPQRVHAAYFQASAQLSVALEASMKFSVETEAVPRAGVDAAAEAKVLAGPFTIDIGQTELDVSGEGDRDIGWVYRVRRALEGKNDFRSFLVLKVARETEKVRLLANIGVRTYRRTWKTLWLREKLPILYASAALDIELPNRD
ncbi:hypothetical protein WMF27_01225 [Sorangium sp. So ce281]|uniref:hypothetical protein n=1 Tax=unclassified Sorangium TaxID=2621164 RepID=UPI003F618578